MGILDIFYCFTLKKKVREHHLLVRDGHGVTLCYLHDKKRLKSCVKGSVYKGQRALHTAVLFMYTLLVSPCWEQLSHTIHCAMFYCTSDIAKGFWWVQFDPHQNISCTIDFQSWLKLKIEEMITRCSHQAMYSTYLSADSYQIHRWHGRVCICNVRPSFLTFVWNCVHSPSTWWGAQRSLQRFRYSFKMEISFVSLE